MSTKTLCLARDLPPGLAKKLNATPPTRRAALVPDKRWPNGSTLRLSFLDGDPNLQAQVAAVATQWTKFANLNFNFLNGFDPNSDVLISFNNQYRPGGARASWSLIGQDCANPQARQGGPSMYLFNDFQTNDELNRIVLHEFGHTLGLIHEHKSIASTLQFDVQKTIAYFGSGAGLSPDDVMEQVINRDYTATSYTDFDPDSIMLYEFPAEIMLDGIGTHANSHLSPTDISFIESSQGYPGRSGTNTSTTSTGTVTSDPNPVYPLDVPDIVLKTIAPNQTHHFPFTVANAGPYRVTTQDEDGPLNLDLFGPDNETKRKDSDGPGKGLSTSNFLPAGKYWVQITAAHASGPLTYKLKVIKG
jgi:hypothetical protein